MSKNNISATTNANTNTTNATIEFPALERLWTAYDVWANGERVSVIGDPFKAAKAESIGRSWVYGEPNHPKEVGVFNAIDRAPVAVFYDGEQVVGDLFTDCMAAAVEFVNAYLGDYNRKEVINIWERGLHRVPEAKRLAADIIHIIDDGVRWQSNTAEGLCWPELWFGELYGWLR